MGFAVRAILFSAIIGAGATIVFLWSWIRTPPLGTFDDECFNPTDDLNGYGYSITSHLHTGDVGRNRPPSDDEESINHWFAIRLLDLESDEHRLQQESQMLSDVRERCAAYAERCAPNRLLCHFGECVHRRLDSAPWRQQARALDALIREKQTQYEAEETAHCILSEFFALWSNLWPHSVPNLLTTEECCGRARLRGPDVLRRLPALGVSCPGTVD